MLVTHFHFGGRCEEAIELYSKAFETIEDYVERDDNGHIIHAEMHILGQRVMMNDNYGVIASSDDEFSIQMVPIFKTEDELHKCYDILKVGAISASQPERTFYSPLVANITDKFGIRWGLMVEESKE